MTLNETWKKIVTRIPSKHIGPVEARNAFGCRAALGRFAEANTVRYLEVGCRRGHSLAMVTMMAKELECAVTIDYWVPNYGGESNPGPGVVRSNLVALGVDCSKVVFMTGDSHDILPSLSERMNRFNLILVDGDHSYAGAQADLRDCVKLLERGGLLVFDDASGYLLNAWRSTTLGWNRFMREEHLDVTPPWCGATRL